VKNGTRAGTVLAAVAFLGALAAVPAGATLPGYNALIGYYSNAGGAPNIWAAGPDGTEPTNVSNDQNVVSVDPAWSPDGSKIAYEDGYSAVSTDGIWVMNADGSNKRQLTSGSVDEWPAWSPDGTQIAFASTRPLDASGDVRHIWLMNSDGSNLHQLTFDSTTLNVQGLRPDWSPDGTKIAFDDYKDVYVISPDGSNVSRLTTDPSNDFDPSFSPDGHSLVFASNRSSDSYASIWRMNADGSGQARLTLAMYFSDFEPVWSPDGARIAFTSTRDNGGSGFPEIWTMNADGSNPAPLRPLFGEVAGGASWQRTLTAPPPPPPPPYVVKCRVPGVVGQKLSNAKRRIARAHCRVGTVSRRRSQPVRRGRVLWQSPKPGTLLKARAKVNLRVGKGP
jgi:Tol biopolymer transport system component